MYKHFRNADLDLLKDKMSHVYFLNRLSDITDCSGGGHLFSGRLGVLRSRFHGGFKSLTISTFGPRCNQDFLRGSSRGFTPAVNHLLRPKKVSVIWTLTMSNELLEDFYCRQEKSLFTCLITPPSLWRNWPQLFRKWKCWTAVGQLLLSPWKWSL